MKPSNLSVAAAALAVTTVPAFAQPDVWGLLKQIEIDEVRKTYPSALTDGAELDVQITGYATPALPGSSVKELLLVSDMGLCPFCGSLDHGATLLVSLADAIPAMEDGSRITLRGTLSPVQYPETWQSVVLKDAQVVER